jgi:putative ABC transport system substrate-binding protein
MQAAARSIEVQLPILHATTGRDFDRVLATLVQLRAGGLVIGVDPLFSSESEQLGALSLHHSVPIIFRGHELAAAGRPGGLRRQQ